MIRRVLLFSLFLTTSLIERNIEAVIFRHDVAEEKYITFAKEPQFAPVGYVTCGHLGSTGTLISPRTVLVSAHAIENRAKAIFKIYDPSQKKEITVLGTAKRHPKYYRETNEENKIVSLFNDVGLIYLERPIKHIKPAKLWTGPVEQNQLCYCAGYGRPGTGLTGPQKSDFTKRAFTNSLDGMISDESFDTFYAIIFYSPDDHIQITNLEGIGSEGDSGAAIFIFDEEKSSFFVTGILNLLVMKGFYHSYNTILPTFSFIEWVEKNKR